MPVPRKRTVGFLRSKLGRFGFRRGRSRLRVEFAVERKLNVVELPRFSKTLTRIVDGRRDREHLLAVIERELAQDRHDDFARGRALRAVRGADSFGQTLVA